MNFQKSFHSAYLRYIGNSCAEFNTVRPTGLGCALSVRQPVKVLLSRFFIFILSMFGKYALQTKVVTFHTRAEKIIETILCYDMEKSTSLVPPHHAQ